MEATVVRSRPAVSWWPPSLLPVALAAFHVLRFYVESGVSPFAILRALVVSIVAALALWAVASVALRDSRKGTVVASLVILAFLGGADIAAMVLVGALLVLVLVLLPRVLGVAFPWYLVPRAGNALALILLLTIAVRGVQNGTLTQLGTDVGWAVVGARGAIFREPPPTTVPAVPDIYVLMLEDYPRADTLERLFDFDSGPFLSALEERAFNVSPRSRANYSNSLLTLVTMFQARHIEAIPELEGVRADRSIDPHGALRHALNEGAVLDILRAHGYEIVAASPGYEQDTLRGADRFFDAGQLNDFELTIIVTTPLASYSEPGPFLDLIGAQFRERVGAEFAFLQDVASEPAGGPRFVLVHLPVPHPPVLFGSQGESVDVPIHPFEYDLADPSRFVALFNSQLAYLNGRVLDAVDAIGRGSRPAVTIVMSDEGIGWLNVGLDPDPATQPLTLLANIFAARTPGGEDLFGPAITPVNVMPILLERYLGEALPRQTDRGFVSSDVAPFDGLEIPNTDAAAGAP
jgi:hypothetical protein